MLPVATLWFCEKYSRVSGAVRWGRKVRLAALARWSKTSAVLGPLGLNAHQRFLPIPAGYLQWYYAIVQNPGIIDYQDFTIE